MIEIAVIGAGMRGCEYMSVVKTLHGRQAKTTAVCESNALRMSETAAKFRIPPQRCFADEKDFFAAGRLADALLVCTQDRSHYRHAMAGLEAGYKNILVEKPVSPDPEECRQLAAAAREAGARVLVCHVLRYANYYKKIKAILDSGELGAVVSINHTENVGYFHFAHSFVRGNWRREGETSPSLLAKCCHDIDMIQWFMGAPCLSVTSLGGLRLFTAANAPQGAADRCLGGCAVKSSCPYDAERLYIKDPFYRATFIKYLGRVLTDSMKSPKAAKLKALREGPYGRCVYRCDNDVADHQSVSMDFGSGRTALHTMNAFSRKMYRTTHIMCEKGEITGRDCDTGLSVKVFGGGEKKVRTRFIPVTGHLEGDFRLIASFLSLLEGKPYRKDYITFIEATVPSHEIIAAAEISRHNGGQRVLLDGTIQP